MNKSIPLYLNGVKNLPAGIWFKEEPDPLITGYIYDQTIVSGLLKRKISLQILQKQMTAIPGATGGRAGQPGNKGIHTVTPEYDFIKIFS